MGINTVIAHATTIAIICFGVGPMLIWWAQATSRISKATPEKGPYFKRGPYQFLRNPTHLGLVILVAGYTVVSGSVIFLAITLIGYIISNHFFAQYEKVLHMIYGDTYSTYKKNVPKIL